MPLGSRLSWPARRSRSLPVRSGSPDERDVYRRFRQQLGQTVLVGLELLMAGDIIGTVAAFPA
ncbi:MAG TPA: DUF1622 domain-containing protein [Streptosporangiaceae bacterium]|nr:DUF1622 domain-containing protein [Streptosporangiaceae bacterium]